MNRKDRRTADRNGAKLMMGKRTHFQKIENIDESNHLSCSEIWKNNKFFLFVWNDVPTTKGLATKMMIRQHDNQPIKNHWREIQNIKNEFFGKEAIAIEYFPPESKLVDSANLYWIWVFPDNVLPIPIL